MTFGIRQVLPWAAAGAAGAGPDMGGAQADAGTTAGAADDVVDGDYREV